MTALINDTTGTLIASHYVNPRTKIAVIFGTGCNAAYMERVGDIPKLKNLGIDDDAEIAINCEWGAFDSFKHEHLPRTKYDQIVDESSNKVGEQAFEVSPFISRTALHAHIPLQETYFWPIPWRDSATRTLRPHRRRCSFPGSKHLQA